MLLVLFCISVLVLERILQRDQAQSRPEGVSRDGKQSSGLEQPAAVLKESSATFLEESASATEDLLALAKAVPRQAFPPETESVPAGRSIIEKNVRVE